MSIYYILYDLVVFQKLFIMDGYKEFFVRRVCGYFNRDIYFRKNLQRVGKYLYVEDSRKIVRKCLNFSSYDYLGMNECKFPSSSYDYNISDETAIEKLREKLQQFLGYKYATFSASGFSTVALNLAAVVGNGILIYDEYNHASTIDGAKGCRQYVFKHNDINDLESKLELTKNMKKDIYVMIEGLYSMHGHYFKVHDLMNLRKKYNFKIIIDEAHSFGCAGENGKGTFEQFGYDISEVDVYIATFSKTFNSHGGFLATNDKAIYDRLVKNHSKDNDNIPSLSAQQVCKTLDIVMSDEGRKKLNLLKEKTRYLHRLVKFLGYNVFSDDTSPVMCLDAGYFHEAVSFSRFALDNNLGLVIVGYPAADLMRMTLRVCMSAYHTYDDIDYLVTILQRKKNLEFKKTIESQLNSDEFKISDFNNIKTVIDKYGIGTSGPVGFYGTLNIMKEVEEKLATKFEQEQGMLLPHGTNGNKNIMSLIKFSYTDKAVFTPNSLEELERINSSCVINIDNIINDVFQQKAFHRLSRFFAVFGNLSLINQNNISGGFIVGNSAFIENCQISIRSNMFSCALPAYIYYNIMENISK